MAVAISVGIAFTLVTSIHVALGEQVPKILAITRAEGTARFLARPLAAFRALSGPFTVALTKIANAVVRLFGVRPGELEEQHTAEDVRAIIRQSALSGTAIRWTRARRGCCPASSTCTSRKRGR